MKGSLLERLAVAVLVTAGGCAPSAPSRSAADLLAAAELIAEGVYRLRTGELDLADAAFRASDDIAESGASLDGKGSVAFRRGDLETAAGHFASAVRRYPSYTASLLHLAMVKEAQGDFEVSRRLFESAVERDPKSFRARNNYAVFLADRGGAEDRRRALMELRKAFVSSFLEPIRENLDTIGGEDDD